MSSTSTTDAPDRPAPVGRLQHFLLMCAVGLPGSLLVVATAGLLMALPFGIDPMWRVEPLTLPEAAALHDTGEAMRLIGLGADPSKAGIVRAGFVHHEAHVLTPLEAAVAADRADSATLLLDSGAAIDGRTWMRLVCFADVVEAADVRAVLEPRRPAGAPASCDGVEVPW